MPPSLPLVVVAFVAPAATLPTELWQVAPDAAGKPWWQSNTARKDRAVILVPGLKIHPLRPALCTTPERHDWQEPGADLVKALAKDADVFAFGYAQTVPVDAVCHAPGMREAVARVRKAGYSEVVLVGHSAGGIIARQFAESYPDVGVTKVIQVASPNDGTEVAALVRTGYPRAQAPFVLSLAPDARREVVKFGKKLVPPKVEMACVVCKVRRIEADGLVPLPSQWPDELQQQGVPAVLVPVSHWEVTRSPAGIKAIADLAREKLTRWSPEQVDVARKELFRESPEPKK